MLNTFTIVETSSVASSGVSASTLANVRSGILAAGGIINDNFQQSGVDIEISLSIADLGGNTLATGGTSFHGTTADGPGQEIWTLNSLNEIITGQEYDPGGSTTDIAFTVDIDALTNNTFFFDPDPQARTASVPGNQIDFLTLAIHELLHGFGFLALTTGEPSDREVPGPDISPFDDNVDLIGGNRFFTGANAVAANGGNPIRLLDGASAHPLDGVNGIDSIMNATITTGTRKFLSPIELAILEDMGAPIVTPPASADFNLALGTVETGRYGNRYTGATGASDTDAVVQATFTGTASSLKLSFDGFDIDFDNELEVFLNGNSLGFIDAGVNEGTASYAIDIAASAQIAGENELEFRQEINPAFKWGVTNVLLSSSFDFDLAAGTAETGKFGNKFDGATDTDGIVSASFTGTGSSLTLSFDGFDIDFDNELEVFLNGNSLGFIDAGVNEGTASYELAIAASAQNTGENELEFRQAINPAFKWGVTNVLLSSSFDVDLTVGTAETGRYGNKYAGASGASDTDGVVSASFTGAGTDLVLSFDGFDIDFDNELEVFLNGDSLGFIDSGVNEGTASYELAIAASAQNTGENELEFRQAINPAFKWGVTDILLSTAFDFDLTVGTAETGQYGNKFAGTTDTDGVVSASFTGTGSDLGLFFDGFDIDFDNELEVVLNGNSLGFVDAGVNNGTTSYGTVIAASAQNAGLNELEFRQAINPDFAWGVTNVLLDDLMAM